MQYRIEMFAWSMTPDGHGGWICTPRSWRVQYKRGKKNTWMTYGKRVHRSWDAAYAVLQAHANPAQLALPFLGKFEQDAINEKQEWYRRIGASHGQSI